MKKNLGQFMGDAIRAKKGVAPSTGGPGQTAVKTPVTGGAGQAMKKTPVTGGTGRPTVQGYRAGPALIAPPRTPAAKRASARMNVLSRKK